MAKTAKHSFFLFILLALSALPLWAQSPYTGDGGRGIRLAALAPAGTGLSGAEASLPLYIQGMFTDKFKRFSAMTIIDRLGALSGQVVSSGAFGSTVRNDIQARRAWLGMMKECAAFYQEHMPFDIVYDPVLRQSGNTDYINAAANFVFDAALHPAESVFKVLNDLLRGLNNTGNRTKWGFAGWPLMAVNPPDPAAVVFGGERTFTFNIEAALLNENGVQIGRQNFSLTSGSLRFNSGDAQIPMPASDSRTVNFPKVSIKDLTGTGTITLKILKVNGIDIETFTFTGYMRVLTQEEYAALPENRGRR